jgi:hypothetical protein
MCTKKQQAMSRTRDLHGSASEDIGRRLFAASLPKLPSAALAVSLFCHCEYIIYLLVAAMVFARLDAQPVTGHGAILRNAGPLTV